ncbi:MAG: hypothetical protein SWJ54_21950 [Cyanobacteriota bacterium]|nr:hypothetical protein [Cyanobacteriota bacterium]
MSTYRDITKYPIAIIGTINSATSAIRLIPPKIINPKATSRTAPVIPVGTPKES